MRGRHRALALMIALVLLVGVLRLFWRGAETSPSPTTQHALSLRSTAGKKGLTVDLYSPARTEARVPLLVVLQGNDPDPPDEPQQLGADVGDVMRRKGVAVAAVSFELGEERSLRQCAANVAAVIGELGTRSEFSRVVLFGRGVGASLAALLALDRRLLDAAGFAPGRIDGVITVRGTFDLSDAMLDGHPQRTFLTAAAGDRRESSPVTFLRGDAPPFLLLNGGNDGGLWPRLARSFARALSSAGANVESYLVPDRDQHGITRWGVDGDPLGELVTSFIAHGHRIQPLDTPVGVRQRWSKKPPLDNDDLRADARRLVSYPVDAELISVVMGMLGPSRFELNVLPGKAYEAIDLLSYLSSRPESEVGKGDHLIVSNIRDEQLYFSRADLEKTRPVIVVGLDDETNLYRLFVHYRLKQAYSWKKGEEPMPTMIRPLGAFLHFRAPPPPELKNRTYAQFGITSKSFRWVPADPLGAMRGLTGELRAAMLGEQGCLKCHTFKGIGAKAHHVRALDGKPYGAFGLGLDEYPTEVLRRFLFDQAAVARSFDVEPLPIDPKAAQAIFALVTEGMEK